MTVRRVVIQNAVIAFIIGLYKQMKKYKYSRKKIVKFMKDGQYGISSQNVIIKDDLLALSDKSKKGHQHMTIESWDPSSGMCVICGKTVEKKDKPKECKHDLEVITNAATSWSKCRKCGKIFEGPPFPEKECKCELDGFQGAITSQNCPIHNHVPLNTKPEIEKLKITQTGVSEYYSVMIQNDIDLMNKINEIIDYLESK
jgi:hypothetical protein